MVKVCVRGGHRGVDIIETCPLWDSRYLLALPPNTSSVCIATPPKVTSVSNRRIAPGGTRLHFHSSAMQRPRQGDMFMILDEQSEKWVRAVIVDEDIHGNLVLVRFENCTSIREDEWMEWKELFDPSYAKPLNISSAGVQQPPSSMKRRSLASLHNTLPSHHRQAIAAASERYNHYISALRRKGLCVHPVEGDGNCLFRSVSHQVYGTDDLHGLARRSCMDYMKSEAEYFEPYVEGECVCVCVQRRSSCTPTFFYSC